VRAVGWEPDDGDRAALADLLAATSA